VALHSPPDHLGLGADLFGLPCAAEVKRRCGGLDVQPGAAAKAWTQGGSRVIRCVRRPAPPGVSSAAAERAGLPALAGREAGGADEQEPYCPPGSCGPFLSADLVR
jgi:hypothetical protein